MAQLETQHFDPRSPDDSDRAFLATLSARPEVGRFIGVVTQAPKPPSAHIFVIVKDEVRVGVVALVRSDALDGSDFEIVCALDPSAEGQGTATEACRRMSRWGFETLGLPRIIACVANQNSPALKLVRRLGMTELSSRPGRDETVFVVSRDRAV